MKQQKDLVWEKCGFDSSLFLFLLPSVSFSLRLSLLAYPKLCLVILTPSIESYPITRLQCEIEFNSLLLWCNSMISK